VLALSIQEGVPDPFTKIRQFRKAHNVTYPILSDEKGAVITKFGISGIPANVILDRNGKYVYNPDDVDAMVKDLNKLTK